jgi:transposase
MQAVTTIGLDIAKSVFQVHGIDAEGNVLIRRQLKRRYIPGVLREAAAVPGWNRGLRNVTSLVARAQGTRAYRALDAAGLCEALRQAAETCSACPGGWGSLASSRRLAL